MDEYLKNLWGKVVENKELVIRAGCVLAGMAIGAAVTGVVLGMQEDATIWEELVDQTDVSVSEVAAQ